MEEQEKTRPERAPGYYSNVVRIMTNVNGTTILFGRVVPVGVEGEETNTETNCIVDMSPVQAKSLLLILRHQLRNYEETWGKIPVHPAMAEKYGEEI